MSTSSNGFAVDKTYQGDVRELVKQFPDHFIDLCVTSPPYFKLRKYTSGLGGTPDSREIGREQTVEEFVQALVDVFMAIKPKMKPTGSVWVNIDDTYRGGPLMVPEKFCLGMIAAGFKLKNKVIWYKPDPQPESVVNRFTRKYEFFYWFVLQAEYFFNRDATNIPSRLNTVQRMQYNFNKSKQTETSRMRGMIGDMSSKTDDILEGGVDCGDVWIVPTNKDKVPHKAPYPQGLIARPIIACCPESGLVFDPFMGSGRTAIAANRLARHSLGTELSEEYCKLANDELQKELGKWGGSIFLSSDISEQDWTKGFQWFQDEGQLELPLDVLLPTSDPPMEGSTLVSAYVAPEINGTDFEQERSPKDEL